MILYRVIIIITLAQVPDLFESARVPDWMKAMTFLGENPFLRGVIKPLGDVYLPVGSNLNLTCEVSENITLLNGSSLYFKHKALDEPIRQLVSKQFLEVRGQRAVGLMIPDVGVDESGWYYCCLNETSQGKGACTTISQKSVTVSEPPRAISNLTCVSRNYNDMICSWCNQVEEGVRYELHWSIGGNVKKGECQIYTKNCQCLFCGNQQGNCTDKQQDFFHNINYRMKIFAVRYTQQTVSEPFEIITTFTNIVKPDPPTALKVRALNSTALEVKWKAPEGLENSDVYPLDYIVTYTCRKNVETEGKVVNGSTSVVLTKLQPYTEYEVSVRAVPANSHGYQSDERSAKQMTKESKPSAAPVFHAGSFRTSELGSEKRNVTIYWGNIPEDDVNGVLRSFVIQLQSLELNSTDISYCPKNVFTKSVQLDVDKAYLISVAGRTVDDGVSGSIYIPAHHNVHQPKHVEGVVDKNKTSVQFTIIPADDTVIVNYTLLYCEGLIANGILDRRKCKPGSAPVPLTFPADKQTLTFDGHNANYVYAIAVNYEDGGSSGLSPKWLCLFDYDGAPVNPAMRFAQEQEEKSLTIELVRPKCSQDSRGRVTYYELRVLEEDELIRNYTIDVGYSDMIQITMQYLDAFTTYTFVLTACTEVMCSDPRSASHKTLESAPSGPPLNVSAEVQNGQVLLWWQPPIIPNGIITHYLILIKNQSHPDSMVASVDTLSNNTEMVLSDLSGYMNYSFQIKAGNSAGVSDPSEPVHLFMPIKAPGSVTFNAIAVDRSTISIKLTPPQPANGPNPQYLLTAVFNKLEKNYSMNESDYKLTVNCQDKKDVMVNLSVLAVNTLQNGTKIQGPESDVKTLLMCGQKNGIPVINLSTECTFVDCCVSERVYELTERDGIK